MPNLYAGSGAGYTYGIPETPGGRAPSVFNVTYTEQIFNEPLQGPGERTQEQASSQTIVLEDVKNSVIARTAMAYLELGEGAAFAGAVARRAGERGEDFAGDAGAAGRRI